MKFRSFFHIIMMLYVVLMSHAAYAQGAESATSHNDQPIDLVADKGFYDQDNGIATYEGNVIVKQEGMTLWADTLVITLENGSAKHLKVNGAPAKFEYSGQEKPINGEAHRIDYDVADTIVTLTKHAIVTQGTDTIKGEKLTYNLTKDTLGGSRIRMTFTPSNNK